LQDQTLTLSRLRYVTESHVDTASTDQDNTQQGLKIDSANHSQIDVRIDHGKDILVLS
jgi:hypothetical protein